MYARCFVCEVQDCDVCKLVLAEYPEEDFEDNFSQSEADMRERDEYLSGGV